MLSSRRRAARTRPALTVSIAAYDATTTVLWTVVSAIRHAVATGVGRVHAAQTPRPDQLADIVWRGLELRGRIVEG